MADPIPLALQTAYQDLLDRHRRRPAVSIEGSLILKEKSGRKYWIARRRLGGGTVDTQLGPDNSEMLARVEAAKAEQETLAAWNNETSALVAQLRAARANTLDMQTGKIISALARIGYFAGGGVLAGTHAYALYEMELGVRFGGPAPRTEDIDVMADRTVRLAAENETKASTSFDGIGLKPVASLNDPHPYRWQSDDGTPIDILTPMRRGRKPVVELEGLGLHAQALPFLEFALEDPIDAVALYREGVLVRIPAPERYAVHKLIVAAERAGSFRAKSAKDLEQAETLINALAEQRPFELKTAYEDASGRGRKWQSAIKRSLKTRPAIAETLANL